jgi:hypothetical protein
VRLPRRRRPSRTEAKNLAARQLPVTTLPLATTSGLAVDQVRSSRRACRAATSAVTSAVTIAQNAPATIDSASSSMLHGRKARGDRRDARRYAVAACPRRVSRRSRQSHGTARQAPSRQQDC